MNFDNGAMFSFQLNHLTWLRLFVLSFAWAFTQQQDILIFIKKCTSIENKYDSKHHTYANLFSSTCSSATLDSCFCNLQKPPKTSQFPQATYSELFLTLQISGSKTLPQPNFKPLFCYAQWPMVYNFLFTAIFHIFENCYYVFSLLFCRLNNSSSFSLSLCCLFQTSDYSCSFPLAPLHFP